MKIVSAIEILFLSMYKFGKRSSFNFTSVELCFNRSETFEYDLLSNVGYSLWFPRCKTHNSGVF